MYSVQRLLFVFAILCSAQPALAGTSAKKHFIGEVTRVVDGDTLVVKVLSVPPESLMSFIPGTSLRIRLYGIDAPERSQPYGLAAGEALSFLVKGKRVGVVSMSPGIVDRYGRVIGEILLPVVVGSGAARREIVGSANFLMVSGGWAWWYRKYAPRDIWLEKAEKAARRRRAGLWAARRSVPPWEWRKDHKGKW